MHRRLIPLAPAVLAALLVLPACGSDSSSGGGATTAAGELGGQRRWLRRAGRAGRRA